MLEAVSSPRAGVFSASLANREVGGRVVTERDARCRTPHAFAFRSRREGCSGMRRRSRFGGLSEGDTVTLPCAGKPRSTVAALDR